MRIINVAAARMGPIQMADSRKAVVKRMIALMGEAKAKSADQRSSNPGPSRSAS